MRSLRVTRSPLQNRAPGGGLRKKTQLGRTVRFAERSARYAKPPLVEPEPAAGRIEEKLDLIGKHTLAAHAHAEALRRAAHAALDGSGIVRTEQLRELADRVVARDS